jgi:hypothetical protein
MTGTDQAIFDALETRTKRLPCSAYKLATGSGYGFDVSFPDNFVVDEKRMALTIPFADGTRRDGVGDLLEVGGIRTERHRMNPIVLFDHGKSVPYPIAKAEDPETGAYTVSLDPVNQKASLFAFFYQGKGLPGVDLKDEYNHAVFCEQLFDMTVKKFIRSGSIGYQIIQAKQLSPDYERGVPAGMHLLSTLMLEGSLVVLPANQDTVRKMLCMPEVCGKPLSPYLVKSLEPYAPARKAQLGYEGKAIKPDENLPRTFKQAAAVTQPKLPRTAQGANEVKEPSNSGMPKPKAKGMRRPCSPGQRPDLTGCRPKSGKVAPVEGDIALPHGNLSKTKVPPAKWRPGVGTTKKLESQLESQQPKKPAYVPAPEYTGATHDTPQPAGIGGKQPRRYTGAGAQTAHNVNVLGAARKQNTKDLRNKYRNLKGLRRRLRKSIPGSSIVHVDTRNLDKARDTAQKLGVKFEWIGSVNGGKEKVRLTGDDQNIEAVARQYGRKTLKKLKALGRKATKNLNHKEPFMAVHTKDLDTEGVDGLGGDIPGDQPSMPTEAEMSPEQVKEEPYGAQVLRRLHEDHSILLQQYDEMMGILEQEQVKGHLQSVLERIAETLEAGEELFDEAYAELGGMGSDETGDAEDKDLEAPDQAEAEVPDEPVQDVETEAEVGDEAADFDAEAEAPEADTDTLDDNGVPSDSAPEEDPPTGEEVVEGMDKVAEEEENLKGLPFSQRRVKALTAKYSKTHQPGRDLKAKQEVWDKQAAARVAAHQAKKPAPKPEDKPKTDQKGIGNKVANALLGASLAAGSASAGGAVANHSAPTVERATQASVGGAAAGASGATLAAGAAGRRKPSTGSKSLCEDCGNPDCDCQNKPGDTDTKLAPLAIPAAIAVGSAVGGMLNSGEKKMVGEASGFLRDVSSTEFWEDEHRMKSYHYHKTLDGIASLEEAHDALEQGTEVGEMSKKNHVPKEVSHPEYPDPGNTADDLENLPEYPDPGDTGEKSCSHRGMCKGASEFFRELSLTRNFGDRHREKAAYWHSSLDPLSKEEPVEDQPSDEAIGGMVAEEEEKEEEDQGFEPGAIEEKGRLGNIARAAVLGATLGAPAGAAGEATVDRAVSASPKRATPAKIGTALGAAGGATAAGLGQAGRQEERKLSSGKKSLSEAQLLEQLDAIFNQQAQTLDSMNQRVERLAKVS